MSKTIDVSKIPADLKIENITTEPVSIELIPFGTQEIEGEGSIILRIDDSEILLVNLLKAQELGLTTEVTEVDDGGDEPASTPDPDPVDPELVSIAITTEPSKVSYLEGEVFDSTGMVVTATYDDESTEAITDYTYAPTGELTAEDTEITVSYEGKTATQEITVTPANNEDPEETPGE